MNQPTTCPQCSGGFVAKTITHQQPWGDETYEFENVPALVCAQCGDVWLSAEVAQLMESVIKRHPQPKRYRQVPVFSLAEFSL
jgi:YgiT-type zinc finger domain-containing protein